jgi:hypothetical protein
MRITSNSSAYALYRATSPAAGQPADQVGQVVPALPGKPSQLAAPEAARHSAATAHPIPSQALTTVRRAGMVNPAGATPFNATLESRRGGLAGSLGLSAQRAVSAYEGVASQGQRSEAAQVLGIDVFA